MGLHHHVDTGSSKSTGLLRDPDAPGRYAALSTGGNEYSGEALIDEVPLSSVRKMSSDKLIARWKKQDEEEED
jgi:hypothetical protein